MHPSPVATPCLIQVSLPRWCGHVEIITTDVQATADRLRWHAETGRSLHLRCDQCRADNVWPIPFPDPGAEKQGANLDQTTTMLARGTS